MVNPEFRRRLKDAGAPFPDEALDAMDDGDAFAWLERNSDDPWLGHGCRDLQGQPKFIGHRRDTPGSDPFLWFHDTEVTYVALRVLLAAEEAVGSFHALAFHLCQLVIEKGVKAILALQSHDKREEFDPRSYSHDLRKAINSIDTTLLAARKVSILRDVAGAFELGHFVGKYAVNTGGGQAVGLDWMRPIDCTMKIVYDVFRPNLAPRRASFIDAVVDRRTPRPSLGRCGIGPQHIQRSLLWRNPVFFPHWENDLRSLRDKETS